ncbi:2-C-methyl-D-erythritol 4-phosphate cytidylyltransferase [Flavobacterium anhuiense]|uniref:2-C-methyl-D-erythritol 4-phosphate cytidylyltransferase n=1 Tax=Flavobacterium anhuiense TaxID=459526 RepID=UPI003D98C617
MDAIILAAGSGLRMNSNTPKQFLRIKGKPLFIYSLELFDKSEFIDKIYITCNKEYMELYNEFISMYDIKNVECIEGGSTRQESVYKALSYVNTSKVIIHEAARPLIDLEFLNSIYSVNVDADGVVPTIPVKFTVAIGDDFMESELDRSKLHNIQLPQIFNKDILLNAHENAIRDGYEATEDGMLVFHYGGRIKFVKGRESNIKVTTQLDIELIENLLKL